MTTQRTGADAPARARRLGDLGVRAASGLVLLAIALATAKLGGLVFLVAWFAAALAVFVEWMRLPGRGIAGVPLVLGTLALLIVAWLARADAGAALLVLALAAALQAALAESGSKGWLAAGQLYAGLLLLAVVALRFSFPFGSRAIIWLFAVVWSTDVFAYFGGRLIGGPKIWPAVSPSKTWAGTASGLAAGALIGTFAAARDLPAPPAIAQILALSCAASIFSQAGDTFESALKRRFGVKDSGRLIPGHGGVMDRLDGFIAAAIFAFLVGFLRSGLPSIAGGLFYWA